eukprot:scaffold9371_cov211-Amphora_coffeaeformis.AAC.17
MDGMRHLQGCGMQTHGCLIGWPHLIPGLQDCGRYGIKGSTSRRPQATSRCGLAVPSVRGVPHNGKPSCRTMHA